MGVYRMMGTDQQGKHVNRVCIIRAANGDEAITLARAIYGSSFVNGFQRYNDMCEDCAMLGRECEGSHSQVWTGCVRRKVIEKAAAVPAVVYEG